MYLGNKKCGTLLSLDKKITSFGTLLIFSSQQVFGSFGWKIKLTWRSKYYKQYETGNRWNVNLTWGIAHDNDFAWFPNIITENCIPVSCKTVLAFYTII